MAFMSKKSRITPASGGLLAIAFALLVTGRLSAGEDDTKAEKAIVALGGNVVRNADVPGRPIITVNFSTPVTNEALKELAGLTGLNYLNLYRTQVTDAGLKEFVGLKSLRDLDLSQTKVTSAGMAELRMALPKCIIARLPHLHEQNPQ
jgi:hypothetical protein